jgi:hypothetical protein
MRRVRPFLLLALLVTGAPASAQIIPWSEPPDVVTRVAAAPPPAERVRPARRAVASQKISPEALGVALPLPPSAIDDSPLFQALTTPSSVLLSGFGPDVGSGSVRADTSWVGQVTQNATSITVGGTAADDNGWGATGLSLNATGMNYLTITAQRDAGNQAPTLFVQFEDRNSRTKVYSVSTSLFATGTPTTVALPLTGWTIDFGANDISAWSIGGGSVGTVPLRLTFDDLAFTASAIPEPSSYAVLFGLSAGLAVAWCRRRYNCRPSAASRVRNSAR